MKRRGVRFLEQGQIDEPLQRLKGGLSDEK